MDNVDIAVIGAGPAGVVAALRAAELGARTALITRDEFGGMAANEIVLDQQVDVLEQCFSFGHVDPKSNTNSGLNRVDRRYQSAISLAVPPRRVFDRS